MSAFSCGLPGREAAQSKSGSYPAPSPIHLCLLKATGAGRMAQWVQNLLCKCGDLRLVPALGRWRQEAL